jgi:hypothetical protein
MGLDKWKVIVEITYHVSTIIAALGALWIYRRNSRLERARWATTLFEKFYETERYKEVRKSLDTDADSAQVSELVIKEDDKFTDYLNFFEFVAFLEESKQLRKQEVEALFGYFLDCLQRHSRVKTYINDPVNGYE